MPVRCPWADVDPVMQKYHDEEWGVEERDSRALWEKLMLDSFQAGLSWLIILRKREAFRLAFKGFEPQTVARFNDRTVERLVKNTNIVRSRVKIEATIANAHAYLAMQASGEDFSTFLWAFVGNRPIVNATGRIPTQTPVSVEMSAALKGRGFKFIGPTIVYAFMQATGMVNDHVPECFRRGVSSK